MVLIQNIKRLIRSPFFILLFNKITGIDGGVRGERWYLSLEPEFFLDFPGGLSQPGFESPCYGSATLLQGMLRQVH